MNASRTLFVRLFTFAALCGSAPLVQAEAPPIEQAERDVQGYMQCVSNAYNSDQWRSNTVANCRKQFPVVQSLYQGDYNGVTFTREQSQLYQQARPQWVAFDKKVRTWLFSSGLAEQFAKAKVATAYSFDQTAKSIDARFAELDSVPFTWYPAQKTPYRTAQGLNLQQLHQAELQQFTTCLRGTVEGTNNLNLTRPAFERQVQQCLAPISRQNIEQSSAVYQPQAFQTIAEQGWAEIARRQATAAELERTRLEKEYAESWPQVLKALLGKLLLGLLFLGGVYALWRYLSSGTYSGGAAYDGPGSSSDHAPRRASAASYRSDDRTRAERAEPAEKPADLTTFTLKHRKIGRLTTPHRCASCVHWQGQRTSHPVTREWYVKIDTKGPCGHKHPGSPYGIKRDMDGFHCKDFTDAGY
ncbi:hypothetical protein [Pseudomonas sp. Teo4]|uniref:hypothetical protein n=1 Tax=Pseudomonas sp. Teo4 TaxID=3064528 RepID=UPI002ABBA9A4|nr:hypothetical protein [Pseudomonas sp. Teo4]MDZ3991081.1 hypothetical protein [Pseudomonas sp. Teo4]